MGLLVVVACSRSHGPPSGADASVSDAASRDASLAADATTDAQPDARRDAGTDAAELACIHESRLDFVAACDSPPEAHCADERTLQQPPRLGSCVAYQCDYELMAYLHPCFGGCNGDGCRVCPGEAPVRELPTHLAGTIERRCYDLDAIIAGTPDAPLLRDASTPPESCPAFEALDWGGVGEGCGWAAVCQQPLPDTEGRCCYAVYYYCAV